MFLGFQLIFFIKVFICLFCSFVFVFLCFWGDKPLFEKNHHSVGRLNQPPPGHRAKRRIHLQKFFSRYSWGMQCKKCTKNASCIKSFFRIFFRNTLPPVGCFIFFCLVFCATLVDSYDLKDGDTVLLFKAQPGLQLSNQSTEVSFFSIRQLVSYFYGNSGSF